MGKQQEDDGAPTGVDDHDLITWWGLVTEAYTRTHQRVIADLGVDVAVPGPWFEVVLRLLRTPGHRLSMTRLAHEVSLTSGGFTKFADRLVGAGLLERQACPTDRRVTYVALTDRGLEVARRAQARHVEALRLHFLQPLGVPDASRLAEIMRTLREANTRELAG